MDWQPLEDLLQPGLSCVITAHHSLDGDAIGSELALAKFLQQRNLTVHIINQDSIPRIYTFLDEDGVFRSYQEADDAIISNADLLFMLDVSGWARIGTPSTAFKNSELKIVCIDHHATSDGEADLAFVDSTAAATGILIYDLITSLGGTITPQIAEALFVAIATDTGWFRFSNTSSRVFDVVSHLTDSGAVPNELHSLVYEQLRWERMNLLGRGLGELQSAADGRIAWMVFTREMFEETGADSEDVEGIVDLLRAIRGVEIVMLFRQDQDGKIRISLRSKNEANVGKLAEQFGGGGHARAAGIRMSGSVQEATANVVGAAKRILKTANV